MAAPVLCIMGPTGVGKTALAISLAARLPAEIISVDSAMIYCGMDIGTAKPTLAERGSIPHHLIDCRLPSQRYSVGEFCADAQRLIAAIHSRGRIPILVGGTMLYFHCLQYGMAVLPSIPTAVRQQVQTWADDPSIDLHQRLSHVDPSLAQRLHPHDRQRIMRGLEVFQAGGIPLSDLQQHDTQGGAYEWHNVALMPACRQQLRVRLAQRFADMLAAGFEEEVRCLGRAYTLSDDLPSMRCVGYRQMRAYIEGMIDYDTMRHKAVVATGRLAKRQLTWLRGWSNLQLLNEGCVTLPDKVLCQLQSYPTAFQNGL